METHNPTFDDLEAAYANGHRPALLWAVNKLIRETPAPDWIREAFDAALTDVREGVETWDKVFGNPDNPKYDRADSRRRRTRKAMAIYNRAHEIIALERASINDDLFARLGNEFAVSDSQATKLYYKAKDERTTNIVKGKIISIA